MPGFDMADYKEVAERLAELFAKHPGASLRGTYEFVTIGDQARVVYRAECYRTPEDPAPAVGTAWEDIPGKTPYTRGSELQNAETSAWGRAIVAAGASTSKRIASADEMRSAQARQNAGGAPAAQRNQPAAGGSTPSAPSAPSPRPLGESAAGAGAVSSPPAPDAAPASRNQLQRVQAKMKQLLADNVKIADRRTAAGLPSLTKDCTAADLDAWEDLLARIESELEAPFAEAKS